MYLYVFWGLTIILLVCSLVFVLPVLWLRSNKNLVSRQSIFMLTAIIAVGMPVAVYTIYFNLGADDQLSSYYSTEAINKRKDLALIRPIYAKLQREAIKADLNLAVDLANLDLILNFATIHSQLASGILPIQIVNLLNNVLKVAPLQVTALNLLAVHAYKTAEYKVAVNYWQKILQQFTPEMLKSDAGLILSAKIAEARNLQVGEPTK